MKVKNILEWMKQARYDMETADYMFRGGRYFYSVFLCHLALEKALKGLYQKRLDKIPPKTHSLIYLASEAKALFPEKIQRFLATLNQASVVTRYPDNLDKLKSEYKKTIVRRFLSNTKESLGWIRKELQR